MFDKMEEQQKELKEKLSKIEVGSSAGGGAVEVTCDASRTVREISIDPQKMDLEDIDELQEILLVAINDALDKAEEKEREVSSEMLKDLLPPGMGGLSNLFS